MRAFRNIISLFLLLAATAVAGSAQSAKTYVSPDKSLRVIITSVGHERRGAGESVLEIRSARRVLLLKKSFASEDGEHGYGVARAAWTQDSRFFVFSVESSGGHQPLHTPTFVYRRTDRRLLALDDFVGPISAPLFELGPHDLLRTQRWVADEQAVRAVTLNLSELSAEPGREGALR